MGIGEEIKNLRLQNKLTQEELATKADLSKTAIWNYENSKRTPNIAALQKIAVALEVDINDLIPDQQAAIDVYNALATVGVKFEVPSVEVVTDVNGAEVTRALTRREIVNRFYDIGYILQNTDKDAYYFQNQLTAEERNLVLGILKLLFPQYGGQKE